jgi:hypothetical protein
MQTNKTIPFLVLTLTVVTTTLVIGTNSISTVKAQSSTQPALGSRADIFGHVVAGQATQGSFGSETVAPAAQKLGGLSCNSINFDGGNGCGKALNP